MTYLASYHIRGTIWTLRDHWMSCSRTNLLHSVRSSFWRRRSSVFFHQLYLVCWNHHFAPIWSCHDSLRRYLEAGLLWKITVIVWVRVCTPMVHIREVALLILFKASVNRRWTFSRDKRETLILNSILHCPTSSTIRFIRRLTLIIDTLSIVYFSSRESLIIRYLTLTTCWVKLYLSLVDCLRT